MQTCIVNSVRNLGLAGIVLAIGMAPAARAGDVSTGAVQGQGQFGQGQIADWSSSRRRKESSLAARSAEGEFLGCLSRATCRLTLRPHHSKRWFSRRGKISISLVLGQTVWTLIPERAQCNPYPDRLGPRPAPVLRRDAAGKLTPSALRNSTSTATF